MRDSDLHTHSYYSDGIFSPTEIVRKAKEAGIKNLALTDHNSIQGIIEAQKEAKKQKINLIPGVELRCKEGEVLGYFINFKNKKFIKKIKKIQNKSKEIFENTIKELTKKGIIVKSGKILNTKIKKENVLTVYLFKFLKEKGILNMNEIKEIKKSIMHGDLFEAQFSTEEVIKMINDAGGVAVLAHPWYSKTFLDEIRLKELITAGLKGLEIDNGGRGEERVGSLEKINKFAKKYNLILTSGSDFHGDSSLMSNEHKIGANNCDVKIVEKLKKITTN
ncbi:MAG: PHP domain-containing protein [Nanoarchaeota archaeon]|nr:PHP domain-containing protein [Nanoarchaeota archaeon]